LEIVERKKAGKPGGEKAIRLGSWKARRLQGWEAGKPGRLEREVNQ
jgi:hypothetical protein